VLHNACYYGFEEIVHELLKFGADLNVKSGDCEWAPLHFAAYKGHANGM
jgi:ankyrin repeat protein